jgi:sugar phosphate isomerase/epimerase
MNRRSFLFSTAAVAAASPLRGWAARLRSPFRVSVINDEITPDFDHACSVAANDFGMNWIEIRSMWGKNATDLSDDQIAEAKNVLTKYNLRVTDIASPLFKTDWPGAPKSAYGKKGDTFGMADATFKQQNEILEKSIALAKQFGTNKVRCFDFWRLDDVTPYRTAIDDKLQETAEKCARENVLLVLENEFECNTATGREAARLLSTIKTPHLVLNWDPANAVMRGELDAFPAAWDMLPKNRIHHCHCKNAIKNDQGKIVWAPVDQGYIDWTKQFEALRKIGYRDAVSLETHWRGGGTPEQSTRISWAGMNKDLKAASALA